MKSDYRDPLNLGTDRLVTIDELVDLVYRVAGQCLIKQHNLSNRKACAGAIATTRACARSWGGSRACHWKRAWRAPTGGSRENSGVPDDSPGLWKSSGDRPTT